MPKKGTYDRHGYDPERVKGNFGPGSFRDQYDNERMRSLDRGDRTGGVTGVPFEDDMDLEDMEFTPSYGARGKANPELEPPRDADLARGPSGTQWNQNLTDHSGLGPKGFKLSDKRLLEKVCEVLLHSHEVDPTDMEVTVKDGVVYLEGSIFSKGMKIVAEDLVGSIPGVEDVFTRLKIKQKESRHLLSRKELDQARKTDLS